MKGRIQHTYCLFHIADSNWKKTKVEERKRERERERVGGDKHRTVRRKGEYDTHTLSISYTRLIPEEERVKEREAREREREGERQREK